jgi:cytoskeletal protein RodZ
MSVLSRRFERFAVGFSIATFAFFLIGFYAAANNKGQVVFFFAGLVSVCLFASFFLWLAHGFAWAMIPEKPAETKRTAEAMKPAEAIKPAEAKRPAEAMKPAEAKRPAEAMKPAETIKPAEEKVITPEEDPPEARYTITGRRVY